MKLQKSLPQNAAFFERYAELITSLSSVATIAQIITGVCEIGILTALLTKPLEDILPPQYLSVGAFMGAIICAALLQIGLKQVFPYAVRAILFKRFKSLDLAFSIGVFVLTLSLLAASVYLSWHGAKDIAEYAVKPPTEKNTDKQDSDKATAFATAQRLFTSDSATIETKYKGKSEAIESEYMNQINGIERKGQHATTLRADLKTKLAKLQADKATELEAKATDRKATMDKAENKHLTETASIATDNQTAKTKANKKREQYGGYIGYFTAICYVFFLVVFALNEIYHKGANIEIKPLPSQRHFKPSVLSEFFETVKEKLDVSLRTKIQDWADKTPPQPLPLSANALYDFQADVLTDTLKIETKAKEMKVVKLPLKVPKIAAAESTDKPIESVEPKPQRQIGFHYNENRSDSNEITNTTKIVNENRVCQNCGTSYVHRHHKQKYCSDACRIEAFEMRTGRKFIAKART